MHELLCLACGGINKFAIYTVKVMNSSSQKWFVKLTNFFLQKSVKLITVCSSLLRK